MAGSVFLWEGVMKFVFANQGVGRFTKLGFPYPHFTATADGWFEIIGGLLILGGWLTRPIAIPFIIEMLVAMASTKIPLYLGTSPLPLPPVPPQIGFWADPFRICATVVLCVPDAVRSRTVVHRCAVRQQAQRSRASAA
jgi:uncharacterized membrane protein YphA (DoxX/SURF4 family)